MFQRRKILSQTCSFDGANDENNLQDVLLSLSHNEPGIGTTCMEDFVNDTKLVDVSAFGALCADPEIDSYQKGFTRNYSDSTPGRMQYDCECSETDSYTGYIIWNCSPRDKSNIEIPPRNLMQTKDVLFDLTNLNEQNQSNTNAWILGRCRML